MLKKTLKKEGGFTLLELLIVIVIIGILAVLIIPNITAGPKKGRDATRKQALTALQNNIEQFRTDTSNATYPTNLLALTTSDPKYMDAVPTDPKNNGVFVYTYTPNADNTAYSLKACLEQRVAASGPIVEDTSCTGSQRAYTLTQKD